MAVGNDKVIQKMISELNQAKEQNHKQDKWLKHIENVRLLCDLLLEDDASESTNEAKSPTESISTEEMKAMIGKQESEVKSNPDKFKKSTIDHDIANGNSIFDF
ncbi:hypothetical protein J2Z83_001925 [Virgibacillus natechei]|uniref:YwdI family protein n=1 Tax=Virgibacillus natechei TaxID=1216297 RepID=A0ABS4IFU1_9BACI|nr:DUF5327 family protein [Virgibacillus natechei]MBP1969817.1 hypothetical protein [Virgibacillus natechei]UZD12651.1 YwdI family protein [Virgibacillus natechei]